jgi:G3E family GTPase
MNPPPLTLVTGFLGSGKTTLLRRVLDQGAGGRRVAVIVNEFGAVGLDGMALAQSGAAPVIELPGGCLCCAAGSDFLVAVEELLDYAPSHILVETSGLAEPGALVRRANEAGLPIDAVVAVADAVNLDAAFAASPVAAWQLRAADLIGLSKVDLGSDAQQDNAVQRIRELNSRALLVPMVQGQLAPDILFGPLPIGGERAADPDHTAGAGFRSVVWHGDLPLRREALLEALERLPPQIYRLKGRVHCTDAPWPDDVQAVAGRLRLSSFRPKEPLNPLNTLVLLGPSPGFDAAAAALLTALDGCADRPERIAAWYPRYAALF